MKKSTQFVETWRDLPQALKDAVAKGGEESHEIFNWAEQEFSVLEAWIFDHVKSDDCEIAWNLWQHRFDMAESTSMRHEGEFCCLECGLNASFHSHATPRCSKCHASLRGALPGQYAAQIKGIH